MKHDQVADRDRLGHTGHREAARIQRHGRARGVNGSGANRRTNWLNHWKAVKIAAGRVLKAVIRVQYVDDVGLQKTVKNRAVRRVYRFRVLPNGPEPGEIAGSAMNPFASADSGK